MNENELKNTIEEMLSALNKRRTDYEKYQRYYDGNHDLAYATEKFKNAFGTLFKTFSDNLIPPVVNGLADNLNVRAFTVEAGETSLSDSVWRVWKDNLMTSRSNELYRQVLLKGDAFLFVDRNSAQKPIFYINKPENCAAFYDEDNPARILLAIKIWRSNTKKFRLNLYTDELVIKYESTSSPAYTANSQNSLNNVFPVNFKQFKKIGEFATGFGRVPVFHFTNQAAGGDFGRSEISDLIPLNDALNKMVLDMLVASEFGAFRQRWATGIEIQYDEKGNPISPFKAGASGLWTSNNENARFGDFETTNLEQFIKVQESIRAEIARVASIPLHYLMLHSGNLASGRALQTAERRFKVKIQTLQEIFGSLWAEAMGFAMKIVDQDAPAPRFFTQWEDPTSISENEKLESLRLKREGLEIPLQTIWSEAGYGAADIKQMFLQRETEKLLENSQKSVKPSV